jgi:hypothetical protein
VRGGRCVAEERRIYVGLDKKKAKEMKGNPEAIVRMEQHGRRA